MTRGVIKTMAGVLSSSPKDFIQLAAYAGDQLLKGQFSQTIYDSYAFFINKGEIDPKYFDTTQFADLAPEFAELRDGEYGVYKLNQLRKIFINLAKDNGKDSHKKYLLDTALKMDEPEIKVMLADHHLAKFEAQDKDLMMQDNWYDGITRVSGLKHNDLVSLARRLLEEKGLLRLGLPSDKINFLPGSGSLTTMGVELCELMQLEDDPVEI